LTSLNGLEPASSIKRAIIALTESESHPYCALAMLLLLRLPERPFHQEPGRLPPENPEKSTAECDNASALEAASFDVSPPDSLLMAFRTPKQANEIVREAITQ